MLQHDQSCGPPLLSFGKRILLYESHSVWQGLIKLPSQSVDNILVRMRTTTVVFKIMH